MIASICAKSPVLMQFPGSSEGFVVGASLRCARASTPPSQNRARRGPRTGGRAEGAVSFLTRHLFLIPASRDEETWPGYSQPSRYRGTGTKLFAPLKRRAITNTVHLRHEKNL